MSFILDALRKSENERRDQAQPTLAAAPQPAPAKKKSPWLPVLVIVLAINAIVFGAFMLTRDDPPPIDAPVAAPPPPAIQPAAPRLTTEPAATVVPAPRPAPPPESPATRPAVDPVPIAAEAPAAPETIRDGLPSLDQLLASGLISLPSMRVDMHVYSGDASKRFVFVNMSKYREGDRLSEGPTLEEITPEGVIMLHQGQRFRLDRD